MEDKNFTWTPEWTNKMFHLRFENDWLFKKKKQPWKEFRNILLQNGFPNEMTLDHIRKKWSYTYDCYKLAKKSKNKKWIYYKVFDKHFRKNKSLDRYDSWSDEWRLALIKNITESINVEDKSIMWRTVEVGLRSLDLPSDCCIQDIKGLWHYLQVTFCRKYRLKKKNGTELSEWPLYDTMLNYYQSTDPDVFIKLEEEGFLLLKAKSSRTRLEIRKLKAENHGKNIDFHWSRDITESFIQIRLQHEWLFVGRKWAWNELASIMWKDYNFPKDITGRILSHKWSAIYCEYQKAKATSNTSWIYYNLFEAYLGQSSLIDPVTQWNEEWINNFINIRIDTEQLFRELERPHTAWREVEKKLRFNGLPIYYSLLDLQETWIQIMRTFKWKRKFANKGILNEKWPYYELMERYFKLKSEYQESIYKLSNGKDVNIEDDMDINSDNFEDEMKLCDLKQKLQKTPQFQILKANCCRACGKEVGSINLFEKVDDYGLDLAAKLIAIGGIEVEHADNFPNKICLDCLKELEAAFNFRMKCQNVDQQFKNFKKSPIKTEIDIESQDNKAKDANEEQMEIYHLEDTSHIDDHNDDEGVIDFFKEEPKNVIGNNVERKIVKRAVQKARKKYTYDYTRVCEVCGKNTRNLHNHMDSHATEKCYKCDQCGKKFKFKSGLVIHKPVHNLVPKKTCEVCGKTFHVLAQYRKHFLYHANERKFTCETCGKAFHTKEILTVHMRMHTDERPFSCPDCGKTFRTAGCVSRHRRIVHKIVKLKTVHG